VSVDARTEILERIRAAFPDAPSSVAVPREYHRAAPAGLDVIERFAERVADYQATVHRATPPTLGDVVAAALAERGVRRLVVPAGVPAAWLATADVERLADEPALSKPDLDQADGVITGCAIAIAETGTIVLDAGPGQGRRALSLLPDYHLCVVEASRIVGNVPEALERLDPRRPLTWISGPSATSDIELQRVEGVHGPRNLEVVIVGKSRRTLPASPLSDSDRSSRNLEQFIADTASLPQYVPGQEARWALVDEAEQMISQLGGTPAPD
jgi:L-lactate dehydrogenase complex protein LldG